MFQSFEDPSGTGNCADRLSALRSKMRARSLAWYLVPHADEHQNEYLPPHAERLAWLTGFTGSAGFCLVGLEEAYVFVDGRYTVQAARQVDDKAFTIVDLVNQPPSKFAAHVLAEGDEVGFDPWLLTISQKNTWEKTTNDLGASLKPSQNLIDAVWLNQPAAPRGRAWLHPVEHAGRPAIEKLAEIRKTIAADKASHCLLSDPASIAWLFNIRGSDVVHNPLALAYALIALEEIPILFIEAGKFSDEDRGALSEIAKLRPVAELVGTLASLPLQAKLHADPALVSSALAGALPGTASIIEARDPVVMPRAIKNEVEQQGARAAHLRDGVAMTRFLCWLDQQPAGTISEIDAAMKLETFRHKTAEAMGSQLREISFDTISGAGANGAIVHYRVTHSTNATLEENSLYLVDSGGQYVDGTTDITRTVAIGEPTSDAVRSNTLVLKGHIAIALARFPKSTRGIDLDVLARIALWKDGKDFAHGTGHGVGSYLNVHEGPQSISKRGMEPLKPGMLVSNEPGYYKEGEYGIRIENLVFVTAQDNGMLGFETITLCPIDLRLINLHLLDKDEREWLNAYHRQVREKLVPHLSSDEANWLREATREI